MKLIRTLFAGAAMALALLAADPLTNEDVLKLAKAGMSESFILGLIDERPSRLNTDASRLVDLKRDGVSEAVLEAMVRKTAPTESINTDSVIRLTKAGFSDGFILNVIQRTKSKFNTDADRIVELKQAGVSERVIAAMAGQTPGSREIPAGTAISVRLIDEIDSQKSNPGATFRASLAEPLTVGGETVAPRGADATVKLVDEKNSGRIAGRTVLTVELVSLKIRGRDVPVDTSSFSQQSGSRGKETAVRTGVGSAIGAAIGAIAGGGKGAAIGAGVGAGAGAGSQVLTKGERVRIPSETMLTFTTGGTARY